MIEILAIGLLVAFLLSMFLQAFSVGSNKRGILMWGWLCLLIGWPILVLWPPTGVFEMPISKWAFITLLFVSSLGSGYFCGRAIAKEENNKCA